jgi:hypothetical protein
VIVVLSIITLNGEWNGIGKKEGPKIKQVEPASKSYVEDISLSKPPKK